MQKKEFTITDAELEIMRIVWTKNVIPSREICKVLEKKMGWKAPTTKTLIGRLIKKGVLLKEKVEGKFLYRTETTEEYSISNQLKRLMSNVCNKSYGKIIKKLLKECAISSEDIADLTEILKNKIPNDNIECNCIPEQCECFIN